MKKKIILFLLQKASQLVLKFFKPKIILVSGTLGKTSTKDAVAQIFSRKRSVRKTIDNSNNEFGVAFTILSVDQSVGNFAKFGKLIITILSCFLKIKNDYPEFLVVEVGTRAPGDIKNSINYLKADVVIITKISNIPSHIEYFKNIGDLAREEFSTTDYLKENGRIICFKDDVKYLDSTKRQFAEYISEGVNSGSNCLSDWNFTYDYKGKLDGCIFDLNVNQRVYRINCKDCATKAYAFSFLFAILAYKIYESIDQKDVHVFEQLKNPNGRGKIIEGVNGSLVIDDSYNASPDSVLSALMNLEKVFCSGRKIVVLGEMLELGNYTKSAHFDVVNKALKVADEVYLIGKSFEGSAGKIYDSPRKIGDQLFKNLADGDVVLIKGSQANRLEIITHLIAKFQKTVVKNLVRQTNFWKNKLSVVFSVDDVPFYDQNTHENWHKKGFSSEGEALFWNRKSCGIACVKMVAEAFKKEKIEIGSLISKAVSTESYKGGVGWIHSRLADLLSSKFKLNAVAIRNVSLECLKKIIQDGGLIIASVGFGFHRGKNGHLVVVLGYALNEGKISGFYVHHPSTKKELCMVREYVSIETFKNSFSGNIIKIYN